MPDAVYSLVKQTRSPDRVVVIADNCTDRTIEVVEPYRVGFCVEVFETVGNRHKKAGALNQAMEEILPDLNDEDMVLVMDADSFLDETFIESAEERLTANTSSTSAYGGVGGTFQGRSGGGFVGMLQRNEFTRYARDVRRLKGKVLCLTGTATLFSVKALKEVAKE
ncbi:MAG: glycosyltransferase family 2 protein, partial [Actinomycetota bacterium]|nr:glycosyltransferase family 2 protein [Actinomycetota bacterium]